MAGLIAVPMMGDERRGGRWAMATAIRGWFQAPFGAPVLLLIRAAVPEALPAPMLLISWPGVPTLFTDAPPGVDPSGVVPPVAAVPAGGACVTAAGGAVIWTVDGASGVPDVDLAADVSTGVADPAVGGVSAVTGGAPPTGGLT
jgi:hypothetical protein